MGVQVCVDEMKKNTDAILAVKRAAEGWSRKIIDVSNKEVEDEVYLVLFQCARD